MFPFRYVSSIMFCLISITAYFSRSNLSIAVVSMTAGNRKDANTTHANLCPSILRHEDPTQETEQNGEFDWSPELRGNVLACFYWTYCLFQIPSGYIASRFGGKLPIILSFLVTAVISASGPSLANASAYLFIAAWSVMGIFQAALFPGMFVLIMEWFPITERPMVMAMCEAGIHTGNIIMYFVSGFLIKQFTWTSMFYFPAAMAAFTFLVTSVFLRNRPEEHFMISEEETAYIRKGQNAEVIVLQEKKVTSGPKSSDAAEIGQTVDSRDEPVARYAVPWKEMMTNKAVIAMLFMKFARFLIFATVTTNLPVYLTTVLKESLVSVGVMFAIFTCIQFVTSLSCARVSELMIARKWCTRTNCRKIFSLLSSLLATITFMLIPIMRCNVSAVKFLFYLFGVCQGGHIATEGMTPAEIAKTHSAILFSVGNIATIVPGFVAPMAIGGVLGAVGETWLAWDIIVHSFGVFGIAASVFFLFFISAEVQEFDSIRKVESRDGRSASLVSAMSMTVQTSL